MPTFVNCIFSSCHCETVNTLQPHPQFTYIDIDTEVASVDFIPLALPNFSASPLTLSLPIFLCVFSNSWQFQAMNH